LWLAYARHYGDAGREAEFRAVMDRAVGARLAGADDVAEMFVAYAQAELDWGHVEKARRVLARGTMQAARSLRVWGQLIDIEEGCGAVAAARAAYERVLELRIATPQTFVDFARFLEDNAYFEDAFRVYERGIAAFGYPVAVDLWTVYLARFADRYKGENLERTRELFEQALVGCPKEYAKSLFVAYGRLEEEHGLARRALRVYERATAATGGVSRDQRLEMFRFYAAKTAELLGLPATRLVYERGIAELGDADAVALALEYAQAECRLAEIDRARALYGYAAPMADPRTQPQAWAAWHEFEVQHGNEDTFKEMLRVKRLAQTKFNTDARFLAAKEVMEVEQREKKAREEINEDKGAPITNPDALEIDDDDF
ncbi:pre-mRNA-splicing factor syf1, partial [Coemansia aciculifera]